MPYNDPDILGCFFPGFFQISLNTSADSLAALNVNERATYVHEYIHFMQDTTTGFGISNLAFKMHQFSNLFSGINHCTNFKDCYDRYIKLLEGNRVIQSESQEFLCENCDTEGDGYNQNICCNELISINLDSESHSFILEFKNLYNLNSPYMYRFTGCNIKEWMAYFIESKIFHKDTNFVPRFPYKIVDEIISFMFPDSLSDKEIIQLCDLALQSTRPGYEFINCLEHVRRGGSIEQLWTEDIVACNLITGKEEESFKIYESSLKIVESEKFKEALECSYSGECRRDIYDYVYEICTKGANYRIKKRNLLFSELINEDEYGILEKIEFLHRNIGAPNIFNIENNRYFGAFAENQAGAAYFPVLRTLVNRVFSSEHSLKCPYYNNCIMPQHEYHKRELCNENCKENFLLNIVEGKQLCMATALAKSMGIKSTFND